MGNPGKTSDLANPSTSSNQEEGQDLLSKRRKRESHGGPQKPHNEEKPKVRKVPIGQTTLPWRLSAPGAHQKHLGSRTNQEDVKTNPQGKSKGEIKEAMALKASP